MSLLKPNYKKIRQELLKIMDAPEWDDGSYAPVLIRLAWHSSATYDKATNTGGSRGATMRLITEASDPDNAGLQFARAILEPVKARYPRISYADLWVLAAYAAIEHTGGPAIPFRGGRKDATDPAQCPPNGRLPDPSKGLEPGVDADGRPNGWRNLSQHIRDVFGRMGFTDREAVVLLCGGHAYGRCHTDRSGYAGPWVEEPTKFSNEYAKDMVEDEWLLVSHEDDWLDSIGAGELRPAHGLCQYVNKKKPRKRSAPWVSSYPPGMYKVVGPKFINLRRDPDVGSPVIGRPEEGSIVRVLSVRLFGTAVRGLLDCGGWVSIIGSKGVEFLKREGDLTHPPGQFLVKKETPILPTEAEAAKSGSRSGVQKLAPGTKVELSQVATQGKSLVGKTSSGWILLFHADKAEVSVQRIAPGINDEGEQIFEDAGEPNQMMLVSDMCLLWDDGFRPVLEEFAADEEKLKDEFGAAYKKLTELGCF